MIKIFDQIPSTPATFAFPRVSTEAASLAHHAVPEGRRGAPGTAVSHPSLPQLSQPASHRTALCFHFLLCKHQ